MAGRAKKKKKEEGEKLAVFTFDSLCAGDYWSDMVMSQVQAK